MSSRADERTLYGQVVEYIKDRLYLASYSHAPTEKTPFPLPTKPSSPTKKSSKQPSSPGKTKYVQPIYFSIDDSLLYNAFYADFGPLHIGHLYRFAVYLHDLLGDPKNEERVIVFWSHADSRSRANAACLLAVYMVLIQAWPPHYALAPIAQMDPPLMPFRDAGYSQADFTLSIQDVVYGVWKAKEEGLIGLKDFNLEEYECFERVDMGDFNWISPQFVAFASPQHQPVEAISPASPEYVDIPKTSETILASNLPNAFKNVLAHFKQRKVGLVVRLNSQLYSPTYFSALGMTHMDMIFEDGTCPPMQLVKQFIRLAHKTIDKRKAIAVHCKAGLGRTGCLIGAYLIYRHGFTATEVIAYMRFMRPGMVVGPQQHWLHLNQGLFREWWIEDTIREKLMAVKQSTPPRASLRGHASGTATPPGSHKRRALGELDQNDHSRSVSMTATHEDNLPAPTPGQPRKTSKLYGERFSGAVDSENEAIVPPNHEIVTMERSVQAESDESEEEHKLRMLARKSASRSPSGSHKKRAVSCTTTTKISTEWEICETEQQDQADLSSSVDPSHAAGRHGSGALHLGKLRASPSRSASNGVRKTSAKGARIGSASAASHLTRLKQ